MPAPLDQLGRRPFSFYPAIVGIEHNEWVFRRATWTEVEVTNTKTFEHIWIPRRFLGEVAAIEEPFTIVGLVKELEYKAGAVIPHLRRVLTMPQAVNGPARMAAARMEPPMVAPARLAPVIGIRVESGTQSRAWRRVLVWFAAGILACVAAAMALIMMGGHRKALRDARAPGAVERAPFDHSPHF